MKNIFLCFLLAISISGNMQAQGIQFDHGSTWAQIQAKAKAENKMIFMDCYATWCVPCKQMDANVYTDEKVGAYYNAHFISVKVQMDKTAGDDSTVRKWYPDAKMIESRYVITALPSFLFFSPDGKPLHKAVGGTTVDGFIDLGKDAANPDKQFYTRLKTKNFQPGKLDTTELKGLIRLFGSTDKVLIGNIAADYLSRFPDRKLLDNDKLQMIQQFNKSPAVHDIGLNYVKELSKKKLLSSKEALSLLSTFNNDPEAQQIFRAYIASLSDEQLYKKENLQLIISFASLIKTGDKLFNVFYKNEHKVDEILNGENPKEKTASLVVNTLLYNNDLLPLILKTDSINSSIDLDWAMLEHDLTIKYNENIARLAVIGGKTNWYGFKTHQSESRHALVNQKKWGVLWAEAIAAKVEKEGGVDTSRKDGTYWIKTINPMGEAIEKYCDDPRILNEALQWEQKIVMKDPGSWSSDLAILLYKTGHIEQAVSWQEMQVNAIKGQSYGTNHDIYQDSYYKKNQELLQNMKKRQNSAEIPWYKYVGW